MLLHRFSMKKMTCSGFYQTKYGDTTAKITVSWLHDTNKGQWQDRDCVPSVSHVKDDSESDNGRLTIARLSHNFPLSQSSLLMMCQGLVRCPLHVDRYTLTFIFLLSHSLPVLSSTELITWGSVATWNTNPFVNRTHFHFSPTHIWLII